MEEFRIFVICFNRLDGKVRNSVALGRKVSGKMRGFRKKECEKKEEKKIKGNGRGREGERRGSGGEEGEEKEPFLFLSAFCFYVFFLSTYVLASHLYVL